jgi:hypothetical protein
MKTFKQFLEQEDREIHAKQLGAVPDWAPQFAEGNYAVDDITFSAKDGLGSVPFNQSVYYHGLVAEVKPSVFFDLVLEDDGKDGRAREIAKLILKGYAVGIPFITIDTKAAEDDDGPVRVVGHEGRARMAAVKMSRGDKPVPIHVFLSGGTRARDLTPELIAKIKGRLQVEGGKATIMAPFDRVYVKGELA